LNPLTQAPLFARALAVPKQALRAMQEQLQYWKSECDAARKSGDLSRIARCERYIRQCEQVISVLEHAIAGKPENRKD
jgi:hypothetical protein